MTLPIYSIVNADLLRSVSREVKPEEFGEKLESYMTDMVQAMYTNKGVGLAGIQVGDARRILVADIGAKYGESTIHVVNPTILASEGEISMEEGCLSLPGFSLNVTRPERIHLKYFTPLGQEKEEWFEGYPAVILQHECDHLEGETLLDKASHLKRSRYLQKVKKHVRKIQESREYAMR